MSDTAEDAGGFINSLDRADWFIIGVGVGVMTTAFLFWLLTTQPEPDGAVPLALLL